MTETRNTRKEFIGRTLAYAAVGIVAGCGKKKTSEKPDMKGKGNMKTYRTTGTCSRAINYEVIDGVVTACEIVGGCPGNTKAVAKLVIGRKATEVIATLKGIPCRNGTSCPDQLARALAQEIQI